MPNFPDFTKFFSLTDWWTNALLSAFDSKIRVVNTADPTKKAALDSSVISSAATRTYTFPDASGTFALTSNLITVEENDVAVVTPATTLDFLGKDFDVGAAGSEANVSLANAMNLAGIASTPTVFNEDGVDSDFRIEGDTDQNLFFLDASADRVGIGTNTPGNKLQVVNTGSGTAVQIQSAAGTFAAQRFSANASPSNITVAKSRNATPGSHTIVNNGDDLGSFLVQGSDGTGFIPAGSLVVTVDGTPGTNDMPAKMSLNTTPDGTAAVVERLMIRADGNMVFNETGVDADVRIEGDTDANLFFLDASTDSIAIGNNAPTSWLDLKAGTAARAPQRFPSGSLLTTPLAGTEEYDGSARYATLNSTSKRGMYQIDHPFRLTADGSAIGAAIADFFGATSSIDLPASSLWELEAVLYFLKSTAGTVTPTITTSAANYTNIAGHYEMSPAGGMGTSGAPQMAGIATTTTAAAALPASASLTDATKHVMVLRASIAMNAAGNLRIQMAESAGTITPLRGSWYKVRRVPGNVGSFV